MITKYAIENKKKAADPKRQKKSGQEKLYYKAEEELLLRHSEASFSFKTIFRETLEDGTKKNIAGGGQGAPSQGAAPGARHHEHSSPPGRLEGVAVGLLAP